MQSKKVKAALENERGLECLWVGYYEWEIAATIRNRRLSCVTKNHESVVDFTLSHPTETDHRGNRKAAGYYALLDEIKKANK